MRRGPSGASGHVTAKFSFCVWVGYINLFLKMRRAVGPYGPTGRETLAQG
jgi:hypothetical protein